METKKCSEPPYGCGKVKNIEEFHKYKRAKDGRKSICKECQSQKSKEYNIRKKDKNFIPKIKRSPKNIIIPDEHKYCVKCGLVKHITDFGNDSHTKDLLSCYCKDCNKKHNRIKRGWKPKEILPEGYNRCILSCGKIKPISEFKKSSKHKLGVANICKECYNKSMRSKNPTIKIYYKICSGKNGCGIEKPIGEFSKSNRSSDGHLNICKSCRNRHIAENEKDQRKDYYARTKEKQMKRQSERYRTDPDFRNKHIEATKISRKKHAQKTKAREKAYRIKNKEKINKKRREKVKNDINFRLSLTLRNTIKRAIKKEFRSGSAVRDLGCSIEELKLYLEMFFYPNPETGEMMTWENWSYEGWHLDHIIPLSAFDLGNREEFLKACHYTNLQPMWAKENIKKSDKIMIDKTIIRGRHIGKK